MSAFILLTKKRVRFRKGSVHGDPRPLQGDKMMSRSVHYAAFSMPWNDLKKLSINNCFAAAGKNVISGSFFQGQTI